MSNVSDSESDIHPIGLRKRHPWQPDGMSLVSDDVDLLDVDDGLEEEEDDDCGCPLPSTPEDNNFLEAEVIYRHANYSHMHISHNNFAYR